MTSRDIDAKHRADLEEVLRSFDPFAGNSRYIHYTIEDVEKAQSEIEKSIRDGNTKWQLMVHVVFGYANLFYRHSKIATEESAHLAEKLMRLQTGDELLTIPELHAYSLVQKRPWKFPSVHALRMALGPSRMNVERVGGGRGRSKVSRYKISTVEAAFKKNTKRK